MPVYSSVGVAIDKGKLSSDVVYVMLLEIDVLNLETRSVIDTLRFAQNDEDFSYRGGTYARAGFDFSISRSQGELPTVTLSVADPAQAIQARMHEYEGGVDFPVRLIVTSTASFGTPELEEAFIIRSSSANADAYTVEFQLGAENPLSLRWPVRYQFRDRCPWRYKGTECGYTGELPTCDFTLTGSNGCSAHGNQVRFGGFPGIVNRA